jgi:hypothetical protein
MIRYEGLREPLKLGFIEEPIVKVINIASVWSARQGRDVIITSLNDHEHATGSLHYEDKAVDFQVKGREGVDQEAMRDLYNYLRSNLDLGWDVIFDSPGHYNHIHAEWDIRQRRPRAEAE